MDWYDLLIIAFPAIITLWLGRELWKAREDCFGVKAGFVVFILCVMVAGGYLIIHKEQIKKGNIPLLNHPKFQQIKAKLNG